MLTITKINRFKTPNKIERHIDTDGLYLEVTPVGSKSRRYRYKSFIGSWTMKSLGAYPHVSLERARVLRDELKNVAEYGAVTFEKTALEQLEYKEASVYLFQDVLDGSDKVMDLFESQFPKAKLVDWKIKARPPNSSLSAPDQKKEEAIENLLCLSGGHDKYSRSAFCKEYDVPPATMTRWLKTGYFKSRLEEIGFYIEKPEGKPEQFVLKK